MRSIDEVLEDYYERGHRLRLLRQLKSGKEATVYAVESDSDVRALKVYVDPEFRSFQDNLEYYEGKYYRLPSIRKAVRKRSRFGRKFLHESWVRREFYMLTELESAGAHIPNVFEWTHESVLMDFIGDKETLEPAPRLVDLKLTTEQARRGLELVLGDIELFLRLGIVHADLSAYNILWWDDTPYIIDFPQALDARTNPNTTRILRRDVDNIIDYFERYVRINQQSVYRRFNLSLAHHST